MRIDISNRIGTTSNFGGFRGLLDKFSGAAAGYSLRKLSKSATNAVRVRRSSDNTEQDIGFTGTELDTTTLLDFVNARDVAPADYGAGAAAAYSLRYVSDSYTGDVVRVRRDSDNAEADFNPTEITDGTLLAWVGNTASDNGHVTTWYDQSGNSNDATQGTAASQPKIVDAGVLVEENGKPAVSFDGTTYFLEVPSSSSAFNFMHNGTASNMISVARFGDGTNTSTAYVLVDNGGSSSANIGFGFIGNDYRVGRTDGIQINVSRDDTGNFTASITELNRIAGNTQYLINFQVDADNATAADRIKVGLNGDALFGSNTSTLTPSLLNATTNLNIGRFSGNSLYLLGTIQELIFYPSDQSSNRGNIEANVNDYYSIYTSTNDGFVTTWYDQSGNGNDATQGSAVSQPKIVSAGTLVTENGKPAMDFDGSNDGLLLNISLSGAFSFSHVQTLQSAQAFAYRSFYGAASAFRYSSGHYPDSGQKWFLQSGSLLNTGVLIDYNQNLHFDLFNGASSEKYLNGGLLATGNVGTSTATNLYIGGDFFGDYINTRTQEIIIYPSDQSGNRTAIEGNINGHYNIYP